MDHATRHAPTLGLPHRIPVIAHRGASEDAPEHTLAIAIVSYHGAVTYGLLADADAVPDLPVLAGHLRDCLAELVKTAGG